MSGLDISLDAPGKHVGRLLVPHSQESSAWGSVVVPIISIRGTSDGPCVLLTGGSHGDEPEGPIALGELAKSLEAREVRGQVIIVPELNAPAVEASTRISPLDGRNMNRVFPGDARGSVTERIAHAIASECVARATAAVDIHAGGRSLEFVPTTLIHSFEDPARMKRTLELAHAFGAPYTLVVSELDDQGMLDTEVERAGKLFLSTELGGGGRVTPRTAALAGAGVRNVLHHLGVLEGEPSASAETSTLRVPDEGFVIATDEGLFEPAVSLGENVSSGQVIGCVHRRAGLMREPVAHRAPLDGVFVGQRALAATHRGDCLGLVAVPY
jgi:N-alpha-acetyl-L-2,4-diaminobutyrate deacetylase